MAYIVRDQRKSLLGRLDLKALRIIVLDPRGKTAGKDIVKAVTMMTKMPPIAAGQVVSGGQTKEEIDRSVGKLMAKYQDMFEG